MDQKKVIDINAYRMKKKKFNQSPMPQENNRGYDTDEDRKNTFNLFMKVLATMNNSESYK